MLPTDYLKPCIAVMEELAANFGSSIVLCTATQPALSPFFRGDAGYRAVPESGGAVPLFERVTFQNVGTISEDELIEKLQKEEQALCIVNTKKRAQRLYQKMKGEGYSICLRQCIRNTGEESWTRSDGW